jgi:hypothetical protein
MSSNCEKPYTSHDKWIVSIITGLLFLLVSSPFAFNYGNRVTSSFGLTISDNKGCTNIAGLITGAIVFALVLRVLMNVKNNQKCPRSYTSKDKWIIALVGGLLFMLIASPFLFQAVNTLTSMIGLQISDTQGCPNIGGLMLHTIVFILFTRLLLR